MGYSVLHVVKITQSFYFHSHTSNIEKVNTVAELKLQREEVETDTVSVL